MPELPESSKQRAQVICCSCHFINLLLTLTVIGLAVAGILCNCTSRSCGEDFMDKYFPFLMPFSYILYLIECFCSGSRKYINNDMDVTELEDYITSLKAAGPKIGVRIECYHYEKRTRKVSFTDEHGHRDTKEETYEEKVVTVNDTGYLKYRFHYGVLKRKGYRAFEDTTGEVVGVKGGDLIKLEVKKKYTFDSPQSARIFDQHNKNYVNAHRRMDDHIDSWKVFEIPGHEPKILVRNKGIVKPLCLDIYAFWMCSVFLLSWPYRMWFEGISKTRRIVLSKVVYA